MSICIKSEKLLPLSQVTKQPFIPQRRGSGRLHPSTVWRWALHGLNGVKLEIVRVGGTACTSVEALQRFFERLAGGAPTVGTVTPTAAPDAAEIERQLDALGVRDDEGSCGGRRTGNETRPELE
jgi:hypothetical protein